MDGARSGEPVVGYVGQLGGGRAIGVHRALTGRVDDDHDRPGSPVPLDLRVDAGVGQLLDQRLTDEIVSDSSDEPRRRPDATGEHRDVGRRTTPYTTDPRGVVRAGPRRTVRPNHDIFHQVADAQQGRGLRGYHRLAPPASGEPTV
jgi:hypothetical protein